MEADPKISACYYRIQIMDHIKRGVCLGNVAYKWNSHALPCIKFFKKKKYLLKYIFYKYIFWPCFVYIWKYIFKNILKAFKNIFCSPYCCCSVYFKQKIILMILILCVSSLMCYIVSLIMNCHYNEQYTYCLVIIKCATVSLTVNVTSSFTLVVRYVMCIRK